MEIQVNLDGIEEIQDLLDAYPERVKRSFVAAINRTIKGAKTDSASLITKNYNIRAREVRSAISARSATLKRVTGYVAFSSNPIAIDEFMPKAMLRIKRRPATGLSVEVRKGKKELFKGSFLALLSKEKGVRAYERVGKARFPLKRARTSSVSELLASNERKTLETLIKERFNKNVVHMMTEGYKHVGKGKKK